MEDGKRTQERRVFGSIFQRGTTWYVRYAHNGKRKWKGCGTNKRAAEKYLASVQTDKARGVYVEPKVIRTRFEDLAQIVRDDYRVQGRRSTDRLEVSMKHLMAAFSGMRAADIATDRLNAYVRTRMDAGAAASTVRNELNALKRAFHLALDAGAVTRVPKFPTITLHNVREGFFQPNEVASVLAALRPDCRPLIQCLALTGWRKGEALGLQWASVDFAAGIVRLEGSATKTERARTFPFNVLPELRALLDVQREYVSGLERRLGCVIPWVFVRDTGRPILNCDEAWKRACERAGFAGRLIHDLRRSAVRNLVRAGVPEQTAMKLTGHKTRSVFDRYDIVDEADLRDGVAKLAQHLETATRAAPTVLPFDKARAADRQQKAAS